MAPVSRAPEGHATVLRPHPRPRLGGQNGHRTDEPTTTVSARRLTTSSAISLLLRGASALLGALVVGIVGRGMSHSDYGAFSVILAFDALAKSLGDLGVTPIGVRMMSEDPSRRGRIAAALVLAQTAGSLAAIAVFSGVALVVFHSAGTRAAAFIVIASWAFSGLTEMQAVTDSQLRPQVAAWAVLAQSLTWLAGVVVLASIGAPIWAYALVLVATNLTAVTIVAMRARRLVDLQWDGAARVIPGIVRQSLLLGLAGMLVAAYYKIDGIILFHVVGGAEASYYSAAYRFIDVVQFVPATMCIGIVPVLAQSLSNGDAAGRDRIERLYRFLVCTLMVVGATVAVAGATDAEALLRLIYGTKYLQADGLLVVLLAALPFVMANVGLLAVVTASRVTRLYLWTVACATVANITANVMLIPTYGAGAAAWVELATEVFVTVVLLTGVSRQLGYRPPLVRLLLLLGLTGIAVLELDLIRSVNPWVRPGLPALTVGIGAIGLRIVTVSELRGLLSRRQVLEGVG